VSAAQLIRCGALVDLKDGNHGSNHPKAKEFAESGIPFITAANVRDDGIDYEGAPKVSGPALKRLRVGFAKSGDAILTHKGSVGRAALNTRECVLTPQTTYYRWDSSIVNAKYSVYYFRSTLFYQQLAAVMSQTTRDFVPIGEQYRLFLIVPPLQEQDEIVGRADALFALADTIGKQVAAAAARSGRLPPAILAKAFSGELVPTEAELARQEGRDYEPASGLLNRIRSAREDASAERGHRSAGKRAVGQVDSGRESNGRPRARRGSRHKRRRSR
jgi:type I restriction enzyme S subunit